MATDADLHAKVPWDKMHLFFGDERHVGPDDPQSNFKMASETMITKAPLKAEQIHRMKGEYPDPERAAKEYEQDLRTHFHLKDAELPRLDLVLAGMGDEGHTLSLFPGTKALHAQGRSVVHNWVGKLYTERITFTAPAANNAEMILFMVAGKEKGWRSRVYSKALTSLNSCRHNCCSPPTENYCGWSTKPQAVC